MASCGLPSNNNRLQAMLQAAVQSVQWTYSLFWQFCPQQGILIWGDGYYNGAIKTRKTVQPVEVSTEEASLQRSQQLRELYDTLSAGESNQPARRPSAALSPEDLTESEWFYLMCVSFSFPPGLGLPGKAYAKRVHVWLTGANEVDSKVFTRAILAKSARVQTVVCIPLLDGVVELGTTERIPEDLKFIQQVKSFFIDHNQLPHQPPKPALSEQSTSNPGRSSSNMVGFHSPTLIAANIPAEPPVQANQTDKMGDDEDEEEEDEEEEDEEEDADSDSEDGTERNSRLIRGAQNRGIISPRVPEPSELMQVDMSEDIRLGSPDDGSNNLDWDYHLIKQGVRPLEELTQEDTHYSQIVSAILHRQSCRWLESSSTTYLLYSPQSAFNSWSTTHHHHATAAVDSTSQWFLKYILFSVPFLHCKYHNDNSPKSRDVTAADPASRFRKGTPQDELSANHVLAERRRREKLNERFIILRSLVPFVTKMDKASILGDTIEYVKQLRKKIQDLEGKMTRQMEVVDQRSEGTGDPQRSVVTTTGRRVAADKRKMRIVEGSGGARPKAVEEPPSPPSAAAGEAAQVEVSIIECDALVELQCKYREGLLLDVMQKLRGLRVEITTVKSSLNSGLFVAELRAKVKENVSGKKVSIMEVKRAMNQIIPQ